MNVWGTIDDGEIRGALTRLRAFGINPAPALAEVAAAGEASTRLRFRLQQGPDGQRWKPSLRAQLQGGRTLTHKGHLSGSINSQSGKDFAAWGTNRIYAAAHQLGVTIRAKTSAGLRFRVPGGGFAVVKSVTLPARPYLGVNADDRDDILDIFERHIGTASGGAVHAG